MHKRYKTGEFQENISVLLDEVLLASRWKKPSLLFTIHKSIFSQEKAKLVLQKKLKEHNLNVYEIDVDKNIYFFLNNLSDNENLDSSVFFLIFFGRLSDQILNETYNVLNLHRETFIEYNVKAILFLTEREASLLPKLAPDFWAFRHRVLAFGTPHKSFRRIPPVNLLNWHEKLPYSSEIDFKQKQQSLITIYAHLPHKPETMSTRIELLYELSYLFWLQGKLPDAKVRLEEGIELTKQNPVANTSGKLQNGLAIVYYESGNIMEAMALLKSLNEEFPNDSFVHMNLAVVLNALGKRYKSIITGEKVVKYNRENPRLWVSLGFLFFLNGKMDQAMKSFQKAKVIFPREKYFNLALSACYHVMNLREEAKKELISARQLTTKNDILFEIISEAILGNIKTSTSLIQNVIDSSEISKFEVLRDPIINVLFEANQFLSFSPKNGRSQ